MISLLLLGLLLGMRHALEADHLAAVASLATRSKGMRGTVLPGAVWGLGHSLTLLLVTLTALSSAWLGVAYIVVFGIGSIAGMAVLAAVIALPLRGSARTLTGWTNGLEAAIGAGTLLVGAWVLYSTPWMQSLLR